MKHRLAWVLLLFVMVSLGLSCNCRTYASNVSILRDARKDKQTEGWTKKGRFYYYRSSTGKLYRNCLVKIGKHYYCFDKKGHSVRGGSIRIGDNCYYCNRKGFARYTCITVKLTKPFCKQRKSNRDWLARMEHVDWTDTYVLPFTKNIKVVDRKGMPYSIKNLKKGLSLKVYFDGQILETAPAQFGTIYKVVVL